MDRVPDRIKHVVFLDAAVPEDGMSIWDLFGGTGPQDPERFKDGFMQVPWVKPGTPPPHNVKQSIKCFNQPVSYKNPAAKALPVTYVAFVPKDKSADERAKTDKSWQRAVARGWTIRTFPGGHVAQQEDPRGVATLVAMVCGLAPGRVAETEITGKSTCGSEATGSLKKDAMPASAIHAVSSTVPTGRRTTGPERFTPSPLPLPPAGEGAHHSLSRWRERVGVRASACCRIASSTTSNC
jgi:hypothetical protein